MSKKKKAIILSLIVVFALIMSGGLYVWQKYSSIYEPDKVTTKKKDDSNQYKEVSGITNILLIGVDTRKEGEVSHSDALTILTIDDIHKKVKLTSLMRDSFVDIPGYGQQKLTHAYAYGQMDLLKETIEKNFDIKLDNYATIDFDGFKELINAVGGLELEIKDEAELKELNRCIDLEIEDNSSLSKKDAVYLDRVGMQVMNGQQALAFSRMRYVGNGTYDRVRRQREVLEKLLNKVKDTSIIKFPALANSLLPYIKTNIGITDALNLAYTVSKIGNFNVEKLQIPTDKLNDGLIVSKKVGWVHVMDLEANKKVLHDFIFEDIPYDEKKYEQFKYTGPKVDSSSTDITADETEVEKPSKNKVDNNNNNGDNNNDNNGGNNTQQTKPNTSKPNTSKPDTSKPNTSKPETPKPETPKPEPPKPEPPKPENPKPDDTQQPTTPEQPEHAPQAYIK